MFTVIGVEIAFLGPSLLSWYSVSEETMENLCPKEGPLLMFIYSLGTLTAWRWAYLSCDESIGSFWLMVFVAVG